MEMPTRTWADAVTTVRSETFSMWKKSGEATWEIPDTFSAYLFPGLLEVPDRETRAFRLDGENGSRCYFTAIRQGDEFHVYQTTVSFSPGSA